ncbi:YhfC family intramembrane metalloprotease [Leptotrichia sp. oral taxon 847]|uniref:YhfC family intramembrane metalloprotease n=1 Tax=Leptotrichia sp. oral taxon 847 TaxID=1785996 RepID=UPI000767E8C4|nr:YhfC family glutamic-type intramembrane protease [Leptotrichia sp. oral taxon 847]AMD94211.1 hypothetical protein AXF11_00450 [Leptotrichia sp. oral taxon 847]
MNYETIGINTINSINLMIILGILIPVIITTIWKIKSKEPLSTIFTGAATFILFAIILESIPKIFLFQIKNPISNYITSNKWLVVIISALLAGIFEETGRFVAFRFLLKRRKNKKTAISYGIGHSGIEMIFILTFAGIQCLVFAQMINSGQFVKFLEQESNNQVQLKSLQAIPQLIASISFGTLGISLIERIGAILMHITCSILVFLGVHFENKKSLFLIAILLHVFIDTIAGFYQAKILTNLTSAEILIFVFSLVAFIIVYKKIYKNVSNI